MRAVFRFDASPALGAGHAYRCLTLARALTNLGWSCRGVTNREAPATVPALRDSGVLPVSEAESFRAEPADWLVVDHYGLNADWESGCRDWAGSILAIDDLADRKHDCDILLDQTFGRRAEDYDGLVPAPCRVLAGSDFALLRPDFARARPASLARRGDTKGIERILVNLGATDPNNHSLEVLKGIVASGTTAAVDVVLGAAAPHLESIRAQIDAMPQQARLHVEAHDMPALIAAADLGIGAGGTSTWERCCLGLPSLLLVIAENQRAVAEAVAAAGAARVIPGPQEALAGQIAAAVSELAGDAAALCHLSARAAALCDGRGCDRLGLALVTPGRAKDGRPVTLRLAQPADEALILEWQSHPTTRRFARNPAVPTAEEHHRWFTARLADPDCLLTLMMLGDSPAGVIRLDPAEPPAGAPAGMPEGPAFVVSILVAPELRGLGIALEALRFLRRWQAAATVIAEVLPGNDASLALFRAAGYRPGGDNLHYSFPAQQPASGSLERSAAR